VRLNNWGLGISFSIFDNLENVKHNKSQIKEQITLPDSFPNQQTKAGLRPNSQNLSQLVVKHQGNLR